MQFRYRILGASEKPELAFDGDHRQALVAEGYVSQGRYEAALEGTTKGFSGELFVDPTGALAAAVTKSVAAKSLTLSFNSVLADGTVIITESVPAKRGAMLPGLTLPLPGTSMRFPAIEDARALGAAHRLHVEEVSAARGSSLDPSMTAEKWIAIRHTQQRKKKPLRDYQERVAAVTAMSTLAGSLVLVGAAFAMFVSKVGSHAAAVTGGTIVMTALSMGAMFLAGRWGRLYIAPWLVRRGRGPTAAELEAASSAPAPAASASASMDGPLRVESVELNDPTAASYVLGLLPSLLIVASLVNSLVSASQGRASDFFMYFVYGSLLYQSPFIDLVTNRRTYSKKRSKLEIDAKEVRGPRVALPRERIAGVTVAPAEKSTLYAVDDRGRVVLRATGGLDDLRVVERTLAPRRQRLPIAHPLLVTGLGPVVAGVLAGAVLKLALGMPTDFLPAAFGAGALFGAVAGLVPRRAITIAADGVVLTSSLGKERFLPWSEIASVKDEHEVVVIEERGGAIHRRRPAFGGTAAKVVAAWEVHRARVEEAERDTAKAARRRVADVAPPGAYRVAIDDPAELAETVLDSTENQSVRVRAARRLAVNQEAATAREEAAQLVADPAVKRELLRHNEED